MCVLPSTQYVQHEFCFVHIVLKASFLSKLGVTVTLTPTPPPYNHTSLYYQYIYHTKTVQMIFITNTSSINMKQCLISVLFCEVPWHGVPCGSVRFHQPCNFVLTKKWYLLISLGILHCKIMYPAKNTDTHALQHYMSNYSSACAPIFPLPVNWSDVSDKSTLSIPRPGTSGSENHVKINDVYPAQGVQNRDTAIYLVELL